ncbi:Uncharacterised protein [Mycobacteroides abscessus subsp. abscessus]|nr:Uncharacterised protein [Mycobacteroides abscessus subsp. abscessus]SIF38100.1 Uncharacterised protein [Mycobacteroides abscessus subsp. abscessus]SIF84659.1 Uncharacterised protein [Mycobacteroides abscessus subsp. abscessus]
MYTRSGRDLVRDTKTGVVGADPSVSDPRRRFRGVGITRHPIRVHLSTRTATEADRIAPAGTRLWVIGYTVTERGRESSFTVPCVAEAAARRMVRNLLRDRLPGMSEAEVYSEDVG